MNGREKILVLALAIPLLLYCVPYAYATTVSSSYVVSNTFLQLPGTVVEVTATCNTGDYATGGGYETIPAYTVYLSEPAPIGGTGAPDGWTVSRNLGGSESTDLTAYVVCQTPITVGGITVPEFGSLYAAIAIAAIAYFGLSLLKARKTPELTTPIPK
jgi:hypothetical protein